MGTLKSSLGQALNDRKVGCRVKGCDGHWVWRARDQLESFAKGSLDPPERMCSACYELYKELDDLQVECSRPECTNTWTWIRAAQLRHLKKTGSKTPPGRLCDECQAEAANLKNQQVRCRVSGCSGTWTWTSAQQVRAGVPDKKVKPPQRMCRECHQKWKRLEPREMPCRMAGCSGTWTYAREQQLRDVVRGRPVPERMCDRCYGQFKSLQDMEVDCRIPGCDNTWRWPRGAQLQAWVESGANAPGKPPQRMCPACSESYAKLEDRQIQCRIPGCTGTWIDKRGAQLTRIRQSKCADPPDRLCDDCQKKLAGLEVLQVVCMNDGCERTWGWKRGAQLRASRGRADPTAPPERMCDACTRFVNTHPATMIQCGKCGAEILWSTDNQLKVFLGLWREPELCGTCLSEQPPEAPSRQIEDEGAPGTPRRGRTPDPPDIPAGPDTCGD